MSFVEYLEAFARLADKVSLPSLYVTEEELETITKEQLAAQPLCLKIEAFLVRCMDTVVPYNSIMKYYKRPKKSVFTLEGQILEFEKQV